MATDQGLRLTSPVTKLSTTPQPLRAVIYGDPGVGKTTLALTMPRPFVIDTDGGLEGDAVTGKEDISVQSPATYRDLEAIYSYLLDHESDYDTIVFDSLDGLVRLLLNEVVDQGKSKSKGSFLLEVVPEQAEYLANQKQVERIINDFRRLGKNIVLTSAVRVKEGEKRCIDVAPGLKTIVHRWSSLLGELSVVRMDPVTKTKSPDGVPTRVLFIDPSSTVRECKARWAALGTHVIEPDLGTVLSTTKGVKE